MIRPSSGWNQKQTVTVAQSGETPTLASSLERQRFLRWKPECELPLTVINFCRFLTYGTGSPR